MSADVDPILVHAGNLANLADHLAMLDEKVPDDRRRVQLASLRYAVALLRAVAKAGAK